MSSAADRAWCAATSTQDFATETSNAEKRATDKETNDLKEAFDSKADAGMVYSILCSEDVQRLITYRKRGDKGNGEKLRFLREKIRYLAARPVTRELDRLLLARMSPNAKKVHGSIRWGLFVDLARLAGLHAEADLLIELSKGCDPTADIDIGLWGRDDRPKTMKKNLECKMATRVVVLNLKHRRASSFPLMVMM